MNNSLGNNNFNIIKLIILDKIVIVEKQLAVEKKLDICHFCVFFLCLKSYSEKNNKFDFYLL